jgi:H+-translocating NAD(P) transhydrogenase subunit alpha
MIVGVPREIYPGERRVALVPSVIPSLAKAGLEVIVEARAGMEAGYPDADYAAKGGSIVAERAEVFRRADVVLQVLCHGSNDKTGQAEVQTGLVWWARQDLNLGPTVAFRLAM